ncbi:fimbria/pilus outer membrane usher protein [Providencia hangzhouensis]|uniref:fimbria/pilus outer membrane usher protein n=1 Tax=Providencia hangzhouensis TaxID=3031799 RepID=UPI0034DD2FAB
MGEDGRGSRTQLDWDQVYAFRDIASLSAKLFAGEIFIKSDLFDSVRFKGVSMFTDESMMPPNLRGYAPQNYRGCRLKRNGHLITKWPYHQPSESAGEPFCD